MRAVLLSALLLAVSATAVSATNYPAPRQAQIFHRNAHDCLNAQAEPLFMSDWFYDVNAAAMEHRITSEQHDALFNRMMKTMNEDLKLGEKTPPAVIEKFCEKMNAMRPHWSQW
ncbi:MAG TPA: hypothetical protein VHZ29_02825 [Rhizomicrobium sp.]|nr:hypothetical protein [Rhizomicrobium sp.]